VIPGALPGSGRVCIVSADSRAPYFRPSLTKDYLRGEADADDLALEADDHYDKLAIELVLPRSVVALDPEEHTVSLETGEQLTYEIVVVATGSRPAVPPIDGADHPDVRLLRAFAEGHRLRSASATAKRVIVIGSGFIGCEAAASLAARGLEVSIVSTESNPQQQRIGSPAAGRISAWLAEAAVEFIGDAAVHAIERGQQVVLDNGRTLVADMVVLATGVEPQTQFINQAAIEFEDDRIPVNAQMRSDLPDLYAVGDVAFAYNDAAGRRLKVEHWGEAEAMGEVAGRSAAGQSAAWSQAPGFWTQIGRHELKYVGWGDGYDAMRFVEHPGGGFTAWYGLAGSTVGVLTYEADEDYERGCDLVEQSAPFEQVAGESTSPA
jgi:3-phenylpropionate/trans-cinnamate dioxygenase ferredoxin reductase subunit